jgi:dCTP deaminase
MILTGHQIAAEVRKGSIIIDPFDECNINPNSYNFHLGDTLKIYKNKILDPKIYQETESIKIPSSGIILKSDTLYLGHTLETMGSTNFVPIIRGRSSIGRIGIFINITADLIDIGSINQWTLQLHVVQPVKIYPGMPSGQVTFWKTLGKVDLYDGKYQGSKGPMESLIYKDFIDGTIEKSTTPAQEYP